MKYYLVGKSTTMFKNTQLIRMLIPVALFIFTAPIFTIPILAQTSFGVKAGMSVPSLSDNSNNIYSSDFTSISSASLGMFVEFPISSSFSFQPELIYSVKGGQRNGLQPIPPSRIPSFLASLLPAGLVPYGSYDNKSTLNYLEIPLMLKFKTQSKTGISIEAGPYIGLLTSAQQKITGAGPIFLDASGTQPIVIPPSSPLQVAYDSDVNTKKDIKSTNFGVQAGLTLYKRLASDVKIFLEGRAAYGFSKIQREKIFGETKVGSITFSLGFVQPL